MLLTCEDTVLKQLECATAQLNLSVLGAITNVLQMGNERVHALVGRLHVMGIRAGHQIEKIFATMAELERWLA